jgi:hypothetical protein
VRASGQAIRGCSSQMTNDTVPAAAKVPMTIADPIARVSTPYRCDRMPCVAETASAVRSTAGRRRAIHSMQAKTIAPASR